MATITAMIFDLDGTLVQTEKLKALSYAKATVELCPYTVSEDEAIEAFKDFVGLSRKEVAEGLIERFDLEEKAVKRLDEMGVETTWQAFVQIRLKYYDQILADPDMIRGNQWSHNMDLLFLANQRNCKTALATMSHREQVNKVLDILGIRDQFDFIATRDDVEFGKPDPEIYMLAAAALGKRPEECLVIEDSPSGVKAALAAGMHVIAVTTPFTQKHLHEMKLLDERYIIDEPEHLLDAVRDFIDVI